MLLSFMITCQIEPISIDELQDYMHRQADDVFPSLKNEEHLLAFAQKLHTYADFCLCRHDGQLVAMIAFYANGQGAKFAYISHVYVSPGYRQQGLFSRMLNTMISYVIAKGFSEIRLEVDKKNKVALQTYLRNGFNIGDVADTHSVYMMRMC